MDLLRVLILEDEPLISMNLEGIVEATVQSVVVVKASVAEGEKVIGQPFDFVLLDVDLTNGATHGIARTLIERQIPFSFVSGSRRMDLPAELRGMPFIEKPYRPDEIVSAVLSAQEKKRERS